MESLLFIPDISGFTDFVSQTEVEHSRHIISELLELVIESDQLGLTVAEIEGDAVFFYSEGSAPSAADVLEQARRTFIRFHEHLRLYETRRICHCGACINARTLTLKFVAHVGQIGFVEVGGNRKPHGLDVILAHRLLKNPVQSDEYLLITPPLMDDGATPSWTSWDEASTRYDSLGEVAFRHASLTPLHSHVPEPVAPEPYPLMQQPVTVQATLPLPIDQAFELISNLGLRKLWNDDADEILYEADRINRVGTHHQCVINGKLIDFETVHHDFGSDARVVGERMDDNPLVKSFANFWILKPAGLETSARMEVHYEPGRFGRLIDPIFKLFAGKLMRNAMKKLEAAAANLRRTQLISVT